MNKASIESIPVPSSEVISFSLPSHLPLLYKGKLRCNQAYHLSDDKTSVDNTESRPVPRPKLVSQPDSFRSRSQSFLEPARIVLLYLLRQ